MAFGAFFVTASEGVELAAPTAAERACFLVWTKSYLFAEGDARQVIHSCFPTW
jgi:hypothetical protein